MDNLDSGPMMAQVNVKMPEALLEGLKRIYAKHKTPPSDVLRALAVEAVRTFDREGIFQFPLEIVPLYPQRTYKKNPSQSAAKKFNKRIRRQSQIMGKRYPEDSARIQAQADKIEAMGKDHGHKKAS